LSSAALIRVKRSAWMMGMGFPLSTPALNAGLVVASLIFSASWSQSGGRRARAKNEWPGTAKSGLTTGFHMAELTIRWQQSSGHHSRRRPARSGHLAGFGRCRPG
jgi:hypothetical protein